MYLYKIRALRKGYIVDNIFVRSVRELDRSKAMAYANHIHAESPCYEDIELVPLTAESLKDEYITELFPPAAEDLKEKYDTSKWPALGGNFYDIRCATNMGRVMHLCISGGAFPSERVMMAYNKRLGKYKQIEEIYSVEKITFMKVINEYRDKREWEGRTKSTLEQVSGQKRETWEFPEGWLTPHEQLEPETDA